MGFSFRNLQRGCLATFTTIRNKLGLNENYNTAEAVCTGNAL